jgi:hypothetical protein
MILAGENSRSSLAFGHHRERAVAANVVESVDVALPITDKNKAKPGNIISEPITGVTEA